MEQRFKELEARSKYTSYQEELGFAKELNIIRNDFYYKMVYSEDSAHLIDFLYQPLDIMSGDAYTARAIDAQRTFYLVVDGMGKGVSASLTAMIMTSFLNHIIDKMIEHDHFDFYLLVFETINYIKKILLDEEALSLDYILIDRDTETIEYAKFSMPVSLMQTNDGEIIRLKSNNPPLSKYHKDFKISSYDISNIEKFLFYSDGIVENSTVVTGKTYADFIEEDFKKSFTRRELTEKIFSKITSAEDDLTLAFINKIPMQNESLVEYKTFSTSLEAVEKANEWYESLWQSFSEDATVISRAELVFTELFMNAYEHGNLGIDSEVKHRLLEEDTYFERLLEIEKTVDKLITVKVFKLHQCDSTYIVTVISDEGKGFDTQILSQIFRNSKIFNGRGVFVSRKNSMGIYYNDIGNSVLYLSKV